MGQKVLFFKNLQQDLKLIFLKRIDVKMLK